MEFLKSRLAGLSRTASSGLGASNTDECPLHVEEERLARAELALAQSEARRRLHCDPVELAKAVLDPHQVGISHISGRQKCQCWSTLLTRILSFSSFAWPWSLTALGDCQIC